MSHLEERMETDLNYIRDWVWNIGEDVEEALRDAKRLLVLKDAEKAYEIILGDHPINRASRRCDRLCHRFIARYLPGAGALREMASTIRINVILERIGDYAVALGHVDAIVFTAAWMACRSTGSARPSAAMRSVQARASSAPRE